MSSARRRRASLLSGPRKWLDSSFRQSAIFLASVPEAPCSSACRNTSLTDPQVVSRASQSALMASMQGRKARRSSSARRSRRRGA